MSSLKKSRVGAGEPDHRHAADNGSVPSPMPRSPPALAIAAARASAPSRSRRTVSIDAGSTVSAVRAAREPGAAPPPTTSSVMSKAISNSTKRESAFRHGCLVRTPARQASGTGLPLGRPARTRKLPGRAPESRRTGPATRPIGGRTPRLRPANSPAVVRCRRSRPNSRSHPVQRVGRRVARGRTPRAPSRRSRNARAPPAAPADARPPASSQSCPASVCTPTRCARTIREAVPARHRDEQTRGDNRFQQRGAMLVPESDACRDGARTRPA